MGTVTRQALTSNHELARQAQELAPRHDGLQRRAYLCAAIAFGTTSSIGGALKATDIIQFKDVREATRRLVTQLAGTALADENAALQAAREAAGTLAEEAGNATVP